MSFLDKYNKGGVTFDIDISGFTFIDLKSLYKKAPQGEVFGIDGMYINKKSSYGDHPVAILGKEELLVDLPSHLTEVVKDMLKDEEIVDGIRAGKVGFTIEEYEQKKFKKTCYGIKWKEIG